MPPKDKYTDSKLRDEVKEEIHESDKGGAPGQWTARKAQMMAQEYKKRGGDYNTDKNEKDESQENLSQWNGTGKDGAKRNKRGRFEKKKPEQGTKTTAKASHRAKGKRKEEDDGNEEGNDAEDDAPGEAEEGDGKEDGAGQNGDGNAAAEDDDHDDKDEDKEKTSGRKRKASSKEANGSSKKQKSGSGNKSKGTIGSKHMDAEEPAPRGSAERLPKKGQKIIWKAMPGYVDGEVTEVLTSGKKVDGKNVKASEADPKIVMKSNSSGKICVHKPEACFYEDE